VKLVHLAAAGTIAVLGVAALAKPEMVAPFNAHYKIKPESNLGKLHCVVCHLPGGTKLGPYGADMKKAMAALKAKTLTPAVLKKLEALDSDKDGVKNLAEIKADSNPNDAKVKPAKKK